MKFYGPLYEAKSLPAKLQKRNQDVYQALQMVNSVTDNISKIRINIDAIFPSWYDEVLKLADTIGVTESLPRKQACSQTEAIHQVHLHRNITRG